MAQFLSFIRKEFKHIFRDRWTVAILLLLPLIMLMLFGFAITTEVRNTSFAVFDPSHDMATQAIIQRLDANEYFYLGRILNDPREIDDVFLRGQAGVALVFSDHFQEEMLHGGNAQVQIITDGSDPNTARIQTAYVSNIIADYQKDLLRQTGIPYQIGQEIRLLYNPRMKSSYNFVPGIMGMIMILVCALMTSVSIAREKELGTMEVLLVSPIQPLKIILAKAIPYFVISIVDLAAILIFSVTILDVPIAGSLFWLIVVSLVYIFLALALGLLISSLVSTQLVALLISGMAMIVPVIMLSGMIFPVEEMPLLLRLLSNIVPARWYISAVRKLMIKGLDFWSITQELTVLSLMAVAFIAISLKKQKTRLE